MKPKSVHRFVGAEIVEFGQRSLSTSVYSSRSMKTGRWSRVSVNWTRVVGGTNLSTAKKFAAYLNAAIKEAEAMDKRHKINRRPTK